MSFNRTTVECKEDRTAKIEKFQNGFNRTTVECKGKFTVIFLCLQ